MNTGEGYDTAYAFLDAAGTSLTCLLDQDQSVFQAYSQAAEGDSAYAPFPVQAVVGPDGVLVYASRSYDPDAVLAAIAQSLGQESSQ